MSKKGQHQPDIRDEKSEEERCLEGMGALNRKRARGQLACRLPGREVGVPSQPSGNLDEVAEMELEQGKQV